MEGGCTALDSAERSRSREDSSVICAVRLCSASTVPLEGLGLGVPRLPRGSAAAAAPACGSCGSC